MRASRSNTLIRALLLTVATLGISSESAAASVTLRPGGNITANSQGRVTFSAGGLGAIECRLQLRGSLSSSGAAFIEGTTIGAITAAVWSDCNLGVIGRALGLPWSIVIGSMAYAPLTAFPLRIDDAQIEMGNIPFVGSCLYAGPIPIAASLSGSDPFATGLAALTPHALRLDAGSGLCPSTNQGNGMFSLTQQAVSFAIGTMRPDEDEWQWTSRGDIMEFRFTPNPGAPALPTVTRHNPDTGAYAVTADSCRGQGPFRSGRTPGEYCRVTVELVDDSKPLTTSLRLERGGQPVATIPFTGP